MRKAKDLTIVTFLKINSNQVYRFWVLLMVCAAACTPTIAETPTLDSLSRELSKFYRQGETTNVIKQVAEIEKAYPADLNAAVHSGETLYRMGLVKESIVAFDRAVKIAPTRKPFLWQRGMALFDAGEFALGREQFELHRDVNPHDVENATWHYLCVAGLEGVESARKNLLPAPGDSRPPMEQVYELYAGRGSIEQVYAAAEKIPEGTQSAKDARFYAALYVGLFYQAAGRIDEAKQALRKSLTTGAVGYMPDSARVRLKLLGDTK